MKKRPDSDSEGFSSHPLRLLLTPPDCPNPALLLCTSDHESPSKRIAEQAGTLAFMAKVLGAKSD